MVGADPMERGGWRFWGCSPSPSPPPPVAIPTTVHCMGRPRRRTGFRLSPGTRLTTGNARALPPPLQEGGGARSAGGVGATVRGLNDRDRGGGLAPSPSAPLPMAILPRSTAWGDARDGWSPGGNPGHGFPSAIATHCPRPSWAGEEAEGRAGWGLHRMVLRDSDRGGCSPLPASRHPDGDVPAVHCMGRSRKIMFSG